MNKQRLQGCCPCCGKTHDGAQDICDLCQTRRNAENERWSAWGGRKTGSAMAKRGDTDRPAFTETLRAIDDLSELDVYEFRLLVHLWRVGVSWESTRTLAGKCNMSIGKAHQAQKALLEKGYLVHQERAGRMGLAVAVGSQGEQVQPQERSPHEQTQQVDGSSRSLSEHECSPHEQNVHHMNAILNQPLKSTNEEEEAPSPAPAIEPTAALREHFVKRTAIQPNDRTGVYDRDWQQPLGQLLALAGGDVAAAVALLDRALAVARGDNERRKTYTVSCPRSLMGIASNLAATQQTAATVADDDTIWQRALAAVTRRDFTDERLKAAIRAIGGTGRIASANGHDTETLKRSLGHAYRNVAAA